jgi:DNA-binding NtrC family response regulator
MKQKMILLVDDEEIVLKSLARKLRKKGFEVTSEQNGYDAIAKLKETDYDVIISDLIMEGLSGIQLLEEAKKISPDTPVIIVSAYDDGKSADDAMQFGADDYLLKPCNFDDLLFRISCCLKE